MSERALRWLLLCLLVWASPVWAATYYVSTTGSDSASCELSTGTGSPKQHIMGGSGGLACLSAGDTLYLRQGSYPEVITYQTQTIPTGTSEGTRVTIASYPGETATINGSDGINFGVDYLQYITFDRLVLDGANFPSVPCVEGENNQTALSITNHAHHIRFQHGEIKNGTGPLVQLYAASTAPLAYQGFNEVINSKIHDARCSYGMYINQQNTLIDGNEIYDNAGYGIQMYGGIYGTEANNDSIVRNNKISGNGFIRGFGAMVIANGRRMLLYNNLFYNNNQGVSTEVQQPSDAVKFYNNTFAGNGGEGLYIGTGSTNLEVRNNIFFQNSGGAITNNGPSVTFGTNQCHATGTGCAPALVGDPGFASEAGGNFHIAEAGSPAVGSGANLSGSFTTDADGASRPGSGAWTIGAYQFDSTPAMAGPVGTVQAVWHLNANQGTVAGDSVGEHHGAFSPNGGWAAGVLGASAGNFDGTRAITVTNVAGLRSTASKTLSAWIKMTSTDVNACEVVSDGDSSVLRVYPDGSMEGFFYDGTDWRFVAGGTGLLDNAWHHALWTYDSLEQTVWADGAQVGADAQSGAIDYTNGPTLIIGSHGDGGIGHTCTGAIDEVTVLDGWCSPDCVANLYANKDRRARRAVGSAP